jgi:hypothetical protein
MDELKDFVKVARWLGIKHLIVLSHDCAQWPDQTAIDEFGTYGVTIEKCIILPSKRKPQNIPTAVLCETPEQWIQAARNAELSYVICKNKYGMCVDVQIVKQLATHKITVVIPASDLIKAGGKEIAWMWQSHLKTAKLAKKFECMVRVFSCATQPHEMRAPKELHVLEEFLEGVG